MPLNIYNSLKKEKELFAPITPGQVSMYHCGPTVYDRIHIGNLRSFFLADTLRRYFEFTGNMVTQVMNITDIGHISGDADFGEDKMMKLLKRKGLDITLPNMLAAAAEETVQFEADLESLNILHPHVLPKASDHIPEQVTMIQKLLVNGNAYTTTHAIYFDTSTDLHYGVLGGLTTSGQESNSRIEESEKRNVQDFALWKFDDLGFESDLGKGFPGWHIECSAMSIKYLGEEFDIHTGGIDLKPIHHNNEIAQACCATGKNFAHHWMHGEFLNIDNEKMAKSLGNMYTLADLEEQRISPMALRVLFLQSHYRSVMNFSWDALMGAQTVLADLYRIVAKHTYETREYAKREKNFSENKFLIEIIDGYQDDLNTPKSFAQLLDHTSKAESLGEKTNILLDFSELFGLRITEIIQIIENKLNIPEVTDLIQQRTAAREQKDYAESDNLRDQLSTLGISCEDGKEMSYYYPSQIFGVTL